MGPNLNLSERDGHEYCLPSNIGRTYVKSTPPRSESSSWAAFRVSIRPNRRPLESHQNNLPRIEKAIKTRTRLSHIVSLVPGGKGIFFIFTLSCFTERESTFRCTLKRRRWWIWQGQSGCAIRSSSSFAWDPRDWLPMLLTDHHRFGSVGWALFLFHKI